MKKALLTFRFEAKNILSFLFFMLVASGIFAQNAALSVQGVLTKTDGTAVDDGNYSMTFSLWTASGGGTKVHEETLSQVETTGGVYSVLLGQNGFDPTATFSQVYYLGVQVNGGAELSPRPRLTHAPYTTSVVGQNNVFPSVGPVLGDALRAKGGTPTGGTGAGANGFAFGTDGDANGGLFSNGTNNVQLLAGGTQKIQLSSTLNQLFGNTNTENVFATGKVNSNTGFGYHTGGTTTQTGLFFPSSTQATIQANNVARIEVKSNNTNVFTASAGHEFYGGNLAVQNGFLWCAGSISAGGGGSGAIKGRAGSPNGNGFTFQNVVDDTDTGMFSSGDGQVSLQTNGSVRFQASAGGNTTLGTAASATYIVNNLKSIGDFTNVQWNSTTGELGYDNSSRRYKQNIRPFADDFRLILKAQPKIYTRPKSPNKLEIGYIAEEMDSIGLKHLIEYDAEGLIGGYNYEKTILYAVEVLKMQDAAIARLEAEKALLAAENLALKTRQNEFAAQLTELEKRMKTIENSSSGNSRK